MIKTEPFQKYAQKYDAWFDKHPFAFQSEVIAVKQQMASLPQNISGVEIGLGTGRFAEALGIREGVEPVEEMAEFAADRGIEVIKGVAERLPYGDLRFDFVLFVTVCFLENIPGALGEAHRVLKNDGSILLCFLDKDRPIAKSYEAKKQKSDFYKHATFYTVDAIKKMLEKSGFRNLEFSQTLFGELEDVRELQSPKPGFGEGSFVVVRAEKRV
jgi:ubiquinone/menaquinone biosynthesis C-methylase UbiE